MFKSTADVDGGRALYEGYSAVSDTGAHNFLRLRQTVLQRKEDRKMFVQANSRISGRQQQQQQHRCVLRPRTMSHLYLCVCVAPGDTVELVEYESSAAGLIRSFTERFQEDAEQIEADLLEMSRKDAPCWC